MNQERYQQELDPKHTARSVVSRSIAIGVLSGLVGILCCVSPVVLVLLGLTTATAAISLGDTLYYDYGWYFRGAAVVFAGAAFYWQMRGKGYCQLNRPRTLVTPLAIIGGTAAAVYVALYWFTTYLATAFG